MDTQSELQGIYPVCSALLFQERALFLDAPPACRLALVQNSAANMLVELVRHWPKGDELSLSLEKVAEHALTLVIGVRQATPEAFDALDHKARHGHDREAMGIIAPNGWDEVPLAETLVYESGYGDCIVGSAEPSIVSHCLASRKFGVFWIWRSRNLL